MMNDMELDDVVEHVLADEAKFTVDCGCGPLRNVQASGSNFGRFGCVWCR